MNIYSPNMKMKIQLSNYLDSGKFMKNITLFMIGNSNTFVLSYKVDHNKQQKSNNLIDLYLFI